MGCGSVLKKEKEQTVTDHSRVNDLGSFRTNRLAAFTNYQLTQQPIGH